MYYTYAYLREDGTPYYIGKGKEYRMLDDRGKSCYKPTDRNRIIILKHFDSEFDAFKHEIYMISVFGRKDLGTGILRNRTNGGDGHNPVRTDEWKRKQSIAQSGKVLSEETKKKISSSGKGRKKSEAHRKSISEAAKNRWNSGKDNRKENLINRNKMYKGMVWWNDGQTEERALECPSINHKRGRLKKC